MRIRRRGLGFAIRCWTAVAFFATGPARAEPVRLIFDTDMGNDVDDALALAVIHELADRGEARLLAVMISKDNPWCAPYVDAVNTFYGRPDVPIGVVRGGKTPTDGKFVRQVAERKAGGALVYPRDVKSGADLPEATELYRRILADEPDGSVTVVSVGFFTNLARLLGSGADAISNLSGAELVEKKVASLVVMAGAFSRRRAPEFNAFIDAEATRRTLEHWPTPIVASGFEIGLAILYPARSIENDFGYVADHPVAESYRLYVEMPADRPTWDLTAVLYAVRPDRGYFGLSFPGRITLNPANVTQFSDSPEGAHRFLTATPAQVERVREALVQLASSPPLR